MFLELFRAQGTADPPAAAAAAPLLKSDLISMIMSLKLITQRLTCQICQHRQMAIAKLFLEMKLSG